MENLQYRVAELRALPEGDSRIVEFVISDETKDRHGTVLKSDLWKLDNYKRNPVVGWSHSLHGSMFSEPEPDSVIGKGEVFQEGKKLIGRVEFEPAELNPLAEKIYQKVKFGSLRTASVGFIPTGEPEYGKGKQAKGQPDETLYFPGQELLEWSIVNIPSNPRAAKRAFQDETEKFLEMAAQTLDQPIEDLRKMTMKGIMNLISGEGVEQDAEEAENSQEVVNETEDIKIEDEIRAEEPEITNEELAKSRVMRQQLAMTAALAYFDQYSKEIELADNKIKKQKEDERRMRARILNKFSTKDKEGKV